MHTVELYGLTKHRDLATIDRFLNLYADRESSDARMRRWRMHLLPVSLHDSDSPAEHWVPERVPAVGLSHSIQLGLDFPRRAFAFGLLPKVAGDPRPLIGFTGDDLLTLGMSIDAHEKDSLDVLPRAKLCLSEIADQFDCICGMIAVEEPPPWNETRFRRQIGVRFPLHYWERSPG